MPVYYGADKAYGQYGGMYGGASGAPGQEDGGIIGTISFRRILRVISQRWLSIFVFLLVGIIVSFAIHSVSPRIYEAISEFTIDIRRNTGRSTSAIDMAMPDLGNNYAEIFNTRQSQWRSESVVKKIIDNYQQKYEKSSVTDQELISILASSKLELVRNSRIITIAVRSKDPETAMALANAYVQAIESTTKDENKLRCDNAVSQIHEQVEKRRREKDQLSKDLLEFRQLHKVDTLHSQRETAQMMLSKATADIGVLESTESQLVEWEKLLERVKGEPESFGLLSSGIPRAQDIQNEYDAFQKASGEHSTLLAHFTEDHPDVKTKAQEVALAKERFMNAVSRAHEAGCSTLGVTRNQLDALRKKQDALRADLAGVSERIAIVESTISTRQAELDIANRVFQELILDEQRARQEAEFNNEIVSINRMATLPTKPVLPNTMLIFGAGIFLSIALGVLFVLVCDNLEDTIVNLSDIEGRLALKVLAVLPHVRRKKREHVAKFSIEDKYSQFSEAVAGMRNLLDSPRYEAMTHSILVISTQPGEGKTITSTSLAISYAQTGRKVLHVDFDLRRPRIARIWGFELDESRSFSHVLQNAGGKVPDFSKLVNKSSIDGLDIICSLPPKGVTPATIFGSSVVVEFFTWARANYDKIIVDSPPFGIVGDVVSLAVLVDSTFIMCCPDRTHFSPIQHCSRSLAEAGANILGVVVNDVEMSAISHFSPSSGQGYHRYKYGYGYGYGYGYSSLKKAKLEGDGDNVAESPEATDGSEKGLDTSENVEAQLADED